MNTDIELFVMHHDYCFFYVVHSVYIFYVIWTAMSENKLSVIVTVTTTENSINFAIPSSSVLQRESDKFKLHVSSRGLTEDSLNTFASVKQGKGVIISIDGKKKIAHGFEISSGEENLVGFEEAPTLPEPKAKHEDKLNLVDEVKDKSGKNECTKPTCQCK